ncbi:hypothetical protein [Pseudarthrobacter sp. NS4]|nr:hypothetical protein [Pseudarthrobacter sp. NS4]
MIRKLRKLLFPRPQGSSRKMFNRDLLEQQLRDDVFVLLHQQMGGLR